MTLLNMYVIQRLHYVSSVWDRKRVIPIMYSIQWKWKGKGKREIRLSHNDGRGERGSGGISEPCGRTHFRMCGRTHFRMRVLRVGCA